MKNVGNATDDGETLEITVFDYFVKHRGQELTFSAYMPCLDVGKPKRPNYLPLEVYNFIDSCLMNSTATFFLKFSFCLFLQLKLCSLVSLQRYKKALSGMQRASLVEQSRQKPPERIRVVTDVNYSTQ